MSLRSQNCFHNYDTESVFSSLNCLKLDWINWTRHSKGAVNISKILWAKKSSTVNSDEASQQSHFQNKQLSAGQEQIHNQFEPC